MLVLLDTSVWIDHFRSRDSLVFDLLEAGQVVTHEFVIGELALGHIARRAEMLDLMRALPRAPTATLSETLVWIGRHELHGRGIGYIDAHLLTSTALSPNLRLLTRDRRLRAAAGELRLEFKATSG